MNSGLIFCILTLPHPPDWKRQFFNLQILNAKTNRIVKEATIDYKIHSELWLGYVAVDAAHSFSKINRTPERYVLLKLWLEQTSNK